MLYNREIYTRVTTIYNKMDYIGKITYFVGITFMKNLVNLINEYSFFEVEEKIQRI